MSIYRIVCSSYHGAVLCLSIYVQSSVTIFYYIGSYFTPRFSILRFSILWVQAVLYFYYKRSEDMIPWWFTKFRKWYVFRQARKRGEAILHEAGQKGAHLVSETSEHLHKAADNILHRKGSDDMGHQHDPKYDDKDSFSENQKAELNNTPEEDSSVESFEEENKDKVGEMMNSSGNVLSLSDRSKGEVPRTSVQGRASSSLTERLNDEKKNEIINESIAADKQSSPVDVNIRGNEVEPFMDSSDRDYGEIHTGRAFADSLISNLSWDGEKDLHKDHKINDLKPTRRRSGRRRGSASSERKVDFSGVRDLKFDEKEQAERPRPPKLKLASTRSGMMQQFKESESLRSIMVPRDADDFNNEEEVEYNKKWKNISARIDDVARSFIPVSFFIALAIVLSEVMM